MHRLARCSMALLVAAVCGSSPLGAQALASNAASEHSELATTPRGPVADGATAGVRARVPAVEEGADLGSVLQQEPRVGRNMALMIVGGAAVVTGLLIGDDVGAVLAVSGAVVGLYGLYQWVR